MKKKISSGILIHDGESLLMGHSNGNDFFDIPKGVTKQSEDYMDTMIRECNEEFGIDVTPYINNIKYLGRHDYSRYKDLMLYELRCEYLSLSGNTLRLNADVIDLNCSSYYTISNKEMLEIDSYELVYIPELYFKSCGSFYNMITNYNLLN